VLGQGFKPWGDANPRCSIRPPERFLFLTVDLIYKTEAIIFIFFSFGIFEILEFKSLI